MTTARKAKDLLEITLIASVLVDPRQAPVVDESKISLAIARTFKGAARVKRLQLVMASTDELFGPPPSRKR